MPRLRRSGRQPDVENDELPNQVAVVHNLQMPAIQRFEPNSDDWNLYHEMLEHYFNAQGINEEDIKKSVLINFIGTNSYAALRDLCAPTLPGAKSYVELCELMASHFSPTIIIYHERKKFYGAIKRSDEFISDFVIRLKGLASKCKFGADFNQILRDKFVTSMEERILERLCEESEHLTFENAIKIALRIECQTKIRRNHNREADVNFLKNESNMGDLSDEDVHFMNRNSKRNYNSNGQKSNWSKNSYAGNGTKQQGSSTDNPKCIHCGGKKHKSSDCLYKNATCYRCKQIGHIATICKLKTNVNFVQNPDQNTESCNVICPSVDIFNLENDNINNNPFSLKALVNEIEVWFHIDTGAGISAISGELYDQKFSHVPISKEIIRINGYSGESFKIRGVFHASIGCNGETNQVKIYIIENGGPPIFGRDFLKIFKFNFTTLNYIGSSVDKVNKLMSKYNSLFDDKLGEYKFKKIHLDLKPDAQPKFCRARPIPFAFKKSVDEELNILEKCGVISLIQSSDWGTPVVPVLKPNGKIRICGDYKATINKFLVNVQHPIPRIDDLFSKLQGGEVFSKLDFSRGYNQIVLDDESRKLVALSTHRGVFALNRLPFGISPAGHIFQREVEQVLLGIPNVINFIDDILVTGKNEKDHIQTLELVFDRLEKAGFKLEKQKCEFFKSEIKYLGFIISANGLNKNPDGLKAVLNAPVPINVNEVRSFCGFANYYGKFVQNMATTLHPIYQLLRKDIKFVWDDACKSAFDKIKSDITSDVVLCHFNPERLLVLTCDASNVGLSAILSHKFDGNETRPIAFASRTLTMAEKNYSTNHKEALAVVFGTKKYYQYLIGTKFILQTDHKSLLTIFNHNKGIPVMAAGRIQRWALYLSAFDFTIEHIKGGKNFSDALSRLPLSISGDTDLVEPENEQTYLNFITENFPIKSITYTQIKAETRKDRELATVFENIRNNNLANVPTNIGDINMGPYKLRSNELIIDGDVILWGYRVLIPKTLRQTILQDVHSSHMGIVKTKSICRSYFWWPGIDREIENLIRNCSACNILQPDPRKAELIPWVNPNISWSRIHLDYAGPFHGFYFLIIVDAYSKWIEVFKTKRPNAHFTLNHLYEVVTRYGLPHDIVTDNGTQFNNKDFLDFTKLFKIRHTFTPPGYPATNGQAESSVKIVKKVLKAVFMGTCRSDVDFILQKFLFDYRSTKHTVTGETPAKLLLNRELRTRFDLLKPPSPAKNIISSQQNQIKNYPGKGSRNFIVGEIVMVRDYTNSNRKSWADAKIIKINGPRTYMVKLSTSGRIIKRHLNQIRRGNDINSETQ